MYTYIYIYVERERERDCMCMCMNVCIHTHHILYYNMGEDVGFDNNSLPTRTEGVGTSSRKLVLARGVKHIMLKPHILRHHLPDHPRGTPRRCSGNSTRGGRTR